MVLAGLVRHRKYNRVLKATRITIVNGSRSSSGSSRIEGGNLQKGRSSLMSRGRPGSREPTPACSTLCKTSCFGIGRRGVEGTEREWEGQTVEMVVISSYSVSGIIASLQFVAEHCISDINHASSLASDKRQPSSVFFSDPPGTGTPYSDIQLQKIGPSTSALQHSTTHAAVSL